MHGSQPRDGSSPVVKVRARCPGPGTAADMKRVCVHIWPSGFSPRGHQTRHVVCCQVISDGPASIPHGLTEIDCDGRDQI